jgi:2-amino-4-hydroxy-6-hydroxymethyldihydropteridine diphosphokinase
MSIASPLSSESHSAVIAFGANLGDRAGTIRAAATEIDALPETSLIILSSLVESAAVKPEGVDPDAPEYLNAVALIETRLNAHALLAALNTIELAHGRTRQVRWGDRTLDLDIITYDLLEINGEILTLPHPRAHERAFVLAPWLEVDPGAALPGRGYVDELIAFCPDPVREYREAPVEL